MRCLAGFSLIFILGSFVQKEKVALKIDGDPRCLRRGNSYDFTAEVKDLKKSEHLVLNGVGVVLSKSESGWSMKVPASGKNRTVAVTVCKRKIDSEQTRILKKFVFELCE